MSKNLEGIVEKIRSVRAQKLPEIEKKKERLDALLAALQATRGKAKAVAAQYPDIQIALDSLSTHGNIGVDAEKSLLTARSACENALVRLRRDNIHIGVAAKAGQGKSQLLQMLSGLGNEQIPTGGGGACTAVRSIVHNSTSRRAVVHYLTPMELLEKKVYPSYEPVDEDLRHPKRPFALGLAGKPNSLDEFLHAELPTVEPATGLPTQGVNNWNDNVIPLQKALNIHPELKLLLGRSPEVVPLEEVRSFLVKDKGETKHHVVSFVELWTPFEVGLPEGLTVYDLPGLEDPTPGIRDDMLESVKSDADVVFFLLKPPTDGERTLWKDEDNASVDLLNSVYPLEEVKPQDWIQLILNEDTRDGHKNRASINLLLGKNLDGTPSELFASKIPKGFTPVVCNCGSKEAVRQMVDDNIDSLVKQTGRIDDLRIRQAEDAVKAAIAEVRALYDALRNASGDVIAQESGFNFRENFRDFRDKLMKPFKNFKAKESNMAFYGGVQDILSRQLESLAQKYDVIYSEHDQKNKFPAELPVFSRNRIRQEFVINDPGRAIELTVRNQNAALWTLIREELGKCCDEMVRWYFKYVFDIGFVKNPSLNQIISADADAEEAHDRLERFLTAIQASGNYPILESAVEALLHFRVTFEETILPFIYVIPDFDDFNPDLTTRRVNELDGVKEYLSKKLDASQSRERADALFDWLRQKSEEIILGLNSKAEDCLLVRIANHVSTLMRANYNAFIDRFIWGDGCDEEWEHFADRNKSIFWKEEFEAAAANSKLAKDWGMALENLAAAL